MQKLYPTIGKPVVDTADANANRLLAIGDLRGTTGIATGYTGSQYQAATTSTTLNNGVTGLIKTPSATVAQGITGFIGGAGYVNISYVDEDGVTQTGAIPFFKH